MVAMTVPWPPRPWKRISTMLASPSLPDFMRPRRVQPYGQKDNGCQCLFTSFCVNCKTHTSMTKNWNLENLVPKARPELHGFDGGFSVPALASRASARQAVFSAAASLQTGSSTGCSFFVFFPDT
jgi:hypothetical protein